MMKFLKTLSVMLALGCSVVALAHTQTMDCESALLNAEKSRQDSVYALCAFDDEDTALNTWASWARENQAYQALFEVYKRHPNSWMADDLLEELVQNKNASALVVQGSKIYAQQNYPEAIALYSEALTSPMLNTEEKGLIAQNIGLLYLNPQSTYYNAKKGLPLIQKATQQRSALANNIMGIYTLFGLEETPVDEKEAFFHLWRAVLLDCPAAQENLGVYYLLHNKQISKEEAWEEMKDKIFSCQLPNSPVLTDGKQPTIQSSDCDCKQVQERLALINNADEYKFIFKEKDQNILENKAGQRFYVQQGTVLPDGNSVQEIRKNVVILSNPKKVLYLMPTSDCIQFCQNTAPKKTDVKKTTIKPYHLGFSKKECSDILYYAEQLVDTKLPFVGKKECSYSDKLDIANNLLLNE